MNYFSSKISRILLGVLTTATLLLLCTTVFLTPAKASTYGPYEYTASSGKATITGYTGSGGDVVIPEKLGNYLTVVGIGSGAFRDCTTITSITIPDTVTKIDTSAFAGCSGLTSITIPDSVISFGTTVFHRCTSLTSVTIGNNVPQVSYGTFYGCTSLTAVAFGDKVTSIGDGAFESCTMLASVTIPDTVTSIGEEAFYGCTKLTSVTIGDGVTEIGKSAFSGCSRLSTLILGNNVTNIGIYAFRDCDKLTAVTIPDSVTSINSGAFEGCDKLTTVMIPESIINIGISAFSGCASLQYNSYDDGIYLGNASNPYAVFMDTDSEAITSFNLHPQTKVIGGAAFQLCTELASLTLPDGLTTIGNSAFCECKSITSFHIPEGVKQIGARAFYACHNLADVTIPDSVTVIGENAFDHCLSLTSLTIPDSVTQIGNSAFYGCSGLTSMTIPDSVTDIGAFAFASCFRMQTVKIGNGVTSIGNGAFQYCSELTTVIIPDSVTTLGNYVFGNCTSLVSVTMGSNVKSIGYEAFRDSGLKSVYYAGTQAQWKKITIGNNNGVLTGATFYYGHVHDYTLVSPVEYPATCTRAGYIDYTCIYGETYREILPALGHSAGTDQTVILPTCTEKGYTQSSCKNCGVQINTDFVAALDHDFTGKETVVEPTCQAGGYTSVQCIRCEEVTTKDTTAFLGHDFSGKETVVEPTCQAEGYTLVQCIRCEETKRTNVKDVVGHSMIVIPATEPTCSEYGWTVGTECRWCGMVGIVRNPVAKLEHTMQNGICVVCGESEEYVIIFLDEDGETITQSIYRYGDTVEVPADPTKAADNTYTYAFAGWDKEVVACTGDATYTATYTATYIDYTVTFLDEDGAELSKTTYHYGDKVTAPAEPSKAADNTYTYAFAGWDKEVVSCAGDATYTATYKATYIEYTVKFVYEDGTLISEKAYHYGDSVEVPADPEKAPTADGKYTFTGWDKEITVVTGDATYTAQFAFEQTLPDFTADGQVTDADAIYLLRYTLFPDSYPLSGNGDVNCDGQITDADAIYLLRHTLFPDNYPLYPKKEEA